MARIAFTPREPDKGRMTVAIDNDGTDDEIFFGVPESFLPHPDCTAVALATFCGQAFDEIHFNQPLSEKARKAIANRTRAMVTANASAEPRPPGAQSLLNFSGGFDSLAAWLLAPRGQLRLGIAFGHWFQREADFFGTLGSDVICETDFRRKGYARNDWMFMAAPSMLLAEHLHLGAIAFGTIFEASAGHFRPDPAQERLELFEAIGVSDATLTRGLTEFGTALIVTHYTPELVDGSLASLAAPHSEKNLRKRLLIKAAHEYRGGPPPDISAYAKPRDTYQFGKNYGIDFLTVIFARLYGARLVSLWIDNVEDIDFETLNRIDVSWVFKWIPSFDSTIRPDLLRHAKDRAKAAGLGEFDEEDWRNHAAIRNILAGYHKVL